MRALYTFLLFLISLTATAQHNYIWATDRIRSVQVVVDDDQLAPPIIKLGGHQQIELRFDEMGHDYHRLVYHISHCDYQWSDIEGESLFESDYLHGVNGQPLEDYDISFNTTQLYTHYTFNLSDNDIRLLVSGNYRIYVYDEDEYNSGNEPEPLFCAEFCVVENGMSISAEVSSNTDIDFNRGHQQVSYAVNYGSCNVVDPMREVHTVVMQNRRKDNAVIDLEPNIRKANGIEFTHRRELIFSAGNEFHKFETIDMHRPNLNVDNLRWYPPYYHSTLYPDKPIRNYVYDEDQDGNYLLRNAEYDDEEITSEYLWVHFTLQCEEGPLPGGDVYVCGQWTNGETDDRCRMEWDEVNKEYTAAVYLKQGYYNYQLRQFADDGKGTTLNTDGDFYETENEYTILTYYRPQGGRYDRLVGYTQVHTNN